MQTQPARMEWGIPDRPVVEFPAAMNQAECKCLDNFLQNRLDAEDVQIRRVVQGGEVLIFVDYMIRGSYENTNGQTLYPHFYVGDNLPTAIYRSRIPRWRKVEAGKTPLEELAPYDFRCHA